jgi:ParB-like chromosome segregation protein Spo0J
LAARAAVSSIPYARNARTHTEAQVAAIAASIKEWGWTTPALVGEDGGLIAGHARVLAARRLAARGTAHQQRMPLFAAQQPIGLALFCQ